MINYCNTSSTKLNCELSRRTYSNNTLCNVESAALLGLESDSKLSFKAHVDEICKKLASQIAVLQKIRAFLLLSQHVKYYNVVICPVMSYARVIWSSCDKEQLYRIHKLQKHAARVFLYAARHLLLPFLTSSLGSRFMNNQGLISALLFISILIELYVFT